MRVLETERLSLRLLTEGDAAFMLGLLNEPSFLRNIGDRGVRTEAAARRYLREGAIASYAQHGYGLWLVELKSTGEPIGICGLVKRDYLDDPDVGFAFLPAFWMKGYAAESAAAVKHHAFTALGVTRVLAITSPDNTGSIRVLEKIGLRFDRMIAPPGKDEQVRLFTSDR
ncbi:MAG: GNAT family N-acetyltransferase [Gammaproteobacteria bacterium]|nr:GNAT family N-acetyltransferase [Gammaproteobacteria bacterium]